jgi:type VII secretion protein EccB
MLHDPMRTHSRATMVGVCIAAVGAVGVLIFGLLSPAPKAPNNDGIILAKPSGAVYVLLKKSETEKVLVPTFNLASARLLLLSRKSGGQQNQGGQGDTGATQGPVAAEVIPDSKLVDIPRERLAGIPDGPQMLPEDGQRVGSDWAVCDEYQIDRSLNRPASENKIETTVTAGHTDFGPELAESQALLVQAANKKVYLVYRAQQSIRNANTVRAEIDMTNPKVTAALGLRQDRMRQITTGLLNAIPEAPPLKAPPIPDVGKPSQVNIDNLPIGTVVQIQRTDGSTKDNWDYFVILRDGLQQIKKTTGDLIRFDVTAGGAAIRTLRPDQIPAVPLLNTIDESSFPQVIPAPLDPVDYPVACLRWNVVGDGPSADEHTQVHVGDRLPLPRKADGKAATVDIGTPSADGQRLDHFYMPPGRAAVVRGATSRQDFATGPIYLVSDRGVKFGVPDRTTAAALGLANQRPAPDAIMRLLPNGASLNTRDVQQTFDSVAVAPGQFPSTTPKAAGS